MPEVSEEDTGSAGEGRTEPRTIEKEMESSYIDYAMSVIVGRALPDVRDGLKPVHRRILHAMNELGLTADKPYKKSARVVGEVLGKYHPHGDVAVYDTMVRMAQPFSLRYPLVDGQGNFGSVDGDSAAAMRYTEARMSKIASEMLRDIDRETVEFSDNFDASLKEPSVLPALLPNLLVNGSSGIAVGMATNMPPHNLGEVVDALCLLIGNPEVQTADILQVLRGPDFPTAGMIFGIGGIVEAYQTGRGSIKVRARTVVEERKDGRGRIVVTQIPYMVNKASLVENIAQLVKDRRIDGISDIRDESDREGMRIVLELKRDVIPDVVLNQLFKHTAMESTFGVVNLALVDGKPQILTVKQLLQAYLDHRRTVVVRRTTFDLRKAEERSHVLEGLLLALDHLDEVIALIRGSRTPEEARAALIARFGFSERQAREILDTRLQKLTGMEREAVGAEHAGLQRAIAGYRELLADPAKVMGVIECELRKLKEDFGDPRRTEIVYETADLDIEDLIPNNEVIITMSQNDYIKRQPLDVYRQQRRGGKGLVGMQTKEEDAVVDVFTTRAHNYLLFFTSLGRVHWLKAYKIPESVRHSRGRPVVNLLPGLEPGEAIEFVVPVDEFDDRHWVVFATRRGVIKKTELAAYGNPRTAGIIALLLDEGDSVVAAGLSDGAKEVVLATRSGNAVRFDERDARPTGRATRGVRGITLEEGDEVVSMALVREDSVLLTATENGYGKRTPVEEYRKVRRGGKGVITIRTDERNGPVVAVMEVEQPDELIATSQNGMVIRIPVEGISVQGRNTMGVRVMKLEEGDRVRGADRIRFQQQNGEAARPGAPPPTPPAPPEGCRALPAQPGASDGGTADGGKTG
ncbi:MAG: DNA gyrase subunit A [Euryarchaeota archaeon]|nr:DNA gyrase subunit A [Euryarchaeota archaeon]